MKISKLIIITILVTLLSSCTTTRYFSLKPVYDDYKYKREVTIDGVKSSLYVERANYAKSVFKLHVINNSKKNVTIDPAACYMKYYDKMGKDNTAVVFAEDPEMEIAGVNSEISSEKTRNNINTCFNCLDGLFICADSASSIGKKESEEERYKRERRSRRNTQDFEDERVRHDNEMMELNTKKNWVLNNYLRKTTLRPGESISGKIHFSTQKPENNILNIIVPIAGKKHEYKYRVINE